MKTKVLLAAALFVTHFAAADEIQVRDFKYAGPFNILQPVMVDTVNVNDKKFDASSFLDSPLKFEDLKGARLWKTTGKAAAPGSNSPYALHVLKFDVSNQNYVKAKISLGKFKHSQLFVDGKKTAPGEINLLPRTHEFIIKYLSEKGNTDSVDVVITTDNAKLLQAGVDQKRYYSLSDVMDGPRMRGVDLSCDGRYLITSYNDVHSDGSNNWSFKVTDVKTNKLMAETTYWIQWMPKRNAYYFTRTGNQGKQLVVTDLFSGKEQVLVENMPEGSFYFSPDESYLIFQQEQKGPKEDAEVYEILTPNDRQPGWRNRTMLSKLDLGTGILQPLTFGYENVMLQDISRNGRYILYMTSRDRLEKRPTTIYSIYRLDLQTMKSEPIVEDDGFVSRAYLSPDAEKIAVIGSAECLGGVGKNLPEGCIPSMYEYQLYVIDVASKNIVPLTKDFDPSVSECVWSPADGQIYIKAEDRDYVNLFRADPNRPGRIERLPIKEELVNNMSLAAGARMMAYYGESVSNSDRLYLFDTKTKKNVLLEDLSARLLKDIKLGVCKDWDFLNSRGDTIRSRYYLPPNFDPNKKYPMIVYYYGGCSPSSRYFDWHYSAHMYSAQGYIMYVIQPSGAAGFGQEFASRHVDTAGDGVSDDIIEGVKAFTKAHSFVDAKKIGCMGASYGGFMTQYLQTKTDIFAAGVSHAGISDHTSYWGEGYWGFSYSEVSMAGRYPWTDKKLYVDHSPLFNADKVHTPLLFIHGSADTNVPIGESIQMFTALKLLQRPCAFVVVEGQNHHIRDYSKRVKWTNTIFAWFAKWLKDDPTWWNAMYPPKTL